MTAYIINKEGVVYEPFNQTNGKYLYPNPYLQAAKGVTLTLNHQQEFALRQCFIHLSDIPSFPSLTGYSSFIFASLTNATAPDPVHKLNDMFQLLLTLRFMPLNYF